ncbi:hypothetical protein GCM10017779_10940 [Streptomyces capillispiralis]|uniref:Uncharacterized protein n=1 Tax=Streptomyces capillispiralis TaxID=68182 RepID=A0A561TIK4_9ACTN|nr:hypothetical protein FHX78_113941 [Streptomyces capillispiralis]GHH90637.1 hypothetical protein GCM10017779_10940 [Streptomyces capillispiralis]
MSPSVTKRTGSPRALPAPSSSAPRTASVPLGEPGRQGLTDLQAAYGMSVDIGDDDRWQ